MTQPAPPSSALPQTPDTVAQAKSLRAWLTAFQVLVGLYGGMTLLSLLPLLTMPAFLVSDLVADPTLGLETPPTGLLFLVGGLMLALVVLAVGSLIYLLAWGKEWVEKLAAYLYPQAALWAFGPRDTSGDLRPRLQALAATLNKWMVTSAWATILVLGLGALLSGGGMIMLSTLGLDLEGFKLGSQVLAMAVLVYNLVVGLLTWQIFMRLRDYFAQATAALSSGATAGVASAAQRLEQWLNYWVWYLVVNAVLGSIFVLAMTFILTMALDPTMTSFFSGFGLVSFLAGLVPTAAITGLCVYVVLLVRRFVSSSGAAIVQGGGQPLEERPSVATDPPPFRL